LLFLLALGGPAGDGCGLFFVVVGRRRGRWRVGVGGVVRRRRRRWWRGGCVVVILFRRWRRRRRRRGCSCVLVVVGRRGRRRRRAQSVVDRGPRHRFGLFCVRASGERTNGARAVFQRVGMVVGLWVWD
jgi:hypothetical protein